MSQFVFALLFSLLVHNVFSFLSCDDALKSIEPYDHTVKTCELVHGMPIVKYYKNKGFPGPAVNCDTIPGIFASQNRSVEDCLSVGGSSFFRIDQLYSWQEAWMACHGVPGGNLASVRNIQEFIATTQLVEAGNAGVALYSWIGLNDLDQEGVYRWSDDSSITTYSKFVAGEPDNAHGQQNCTVAVRIDPLNSMANSGWDDDNCEYRRFAICKATPM